MTFVVTVLWCRAWEWFVDEYIDADADARGYAVKLGPLFVAVGRCRPGGA